MWARIDKRARRRAVGDPPDAEGRAGALRAPATSPSSAGATTTREELVGGGEGRARSRRADHRLRAPLRDLQARQPDLPGHGPPQAAAHEPAARPVQLVFSGKAHPADRPGQEVLRQVHEAALRRRAAEPRRLHRGLRHQRRPPPGAGGRRLAEQPAPARRRPAAPAARRCCSTAASTSPCSTAGGPRPTTASTASRSATASPTSTSRSRTAATPSSLYDTLENEIIPTLLRARRPRRAARLDRAHEAHASARWAGASTPTAW